MKLEGYYSSGEFAKVGHITKKTIRYYDEQGILKPSYVNPNGARFYTEDDLAKLHQILLFKYLGFSLEEIKEMTIGSPSHGFIKESLILQEKLIEEKIEQLELMRSLVHNTIKTVSKNETVDWRELLNSINLTGLEKSLKNQYKNTSNISARISLHNDYSINKTGWFPWIFDMLDLKPGMSILEVGCGDGSLWLNNIDRLPENINITISDISKGMVSSVRKQLGTRNGQINYKVCTCQEINEADKSFDLVIAGHVLFYCDDLNAACSEIKRVLKNDGRLICSTYGKDHMIQISELVAEFDDRIILAADNLYNKFGKENGKEILSHYFKNVEWKQYEDYLNVTSPEPLIAYILSCHGNQCQYLIDKYKEFRAFVKKKTSDGFHITKDAGVFISVK